MNDWEKIIKSLPYRGQTEKGAEAGSLTEKCQFCGDSITQYKNGDVGGSNESGSAQWEINFQTRFSGTCFEKECPVARIFRERQ